MKKRDGELCFSATDLSSGLGCAHLNELDHQVARGTLKRPMYRDPVLEALSQQGIMHERAYLEHLRSRGIRVAVVEDDGAGDTALERTVRLAREGPPVIYQAHLSDERGTWTGRVDFLMRVESPSDLGPFSYEVADAKLAAETRAGTILQLCLYSDLLGRLQGTMPTMMRVITPVDGFTEYSFRLSDFAAYYRQARNSLLGRLRDEVVSYPEPVEQCHICRWWSRCDKRRRADDHLCLVAGISRGQRIELTDRGIDSLEALATAPSPLQFKPRRGTREALARVQDQARVQLAGRQSGTPLHECVLPVEPGRGLNLLPHPCPGDVFLDLEGDQFVGTKGLEYLFGWGTLTDDHWEYECRWARNAKEERTAFEAFMDFASAQLEAHPDAHIYHYAPYEPSTLKRLASRYATRVEQLDDLLRGERFVDLYRVIRQGIIASVERYSLKDLEPLFGYERDADLAEVRRHKRAVEGLLQLGSSDLPAESATFVERYNEDDCRATAALRRWLEDERAALVARGEDLARPALAESEASEPLSEWLERITALEEKLLGGIPEEASERSTTEQSRWLLAQMLRWHRREEKCVWWERFRLAELEVEDLLDEGKALARLTHEREVDKTRYNAKLRSPVHRFRFGTQEVEIRPGDTLLLPAEKFPSLGEVLDIDSRQGWVDVKTPQKLDPGSVDTVSGVFKDELVSAKSIAKRLEQIASDSVDHRFGIAGADPLAAKLLDRAPMPGLPLQVANPWEAVDRLNGDVLPVQGPPGSGKSYSGARMILRLHQAGKKIGITANSHTVIDNLMRAVHEAAVDAGVTCPRMLRVESSGKSTSDDFVKVADRRKGVAAFREGAVDVFGGTAWLWSSDDAVGLVDTLFIDEAGQMSLANAVACCSATNNMVLLGDPQQLSQPTQATHPEGTDVSVLQHVIGPAATIAEERGLFLADTYRLHPEICKLVSELFYEDRLRSAPGRELQQIKDADGLASSGLRLSLVHHEGNGSRSDEEVARVQQLAGALMRGHYIDEQGHQRPLTQDDVLIVAPYNAQVNALRDAMPNLRIGTVDKFQGQEAPAVIYSMTSSSPEDAPRGMEFLYDPHRFNVAISRARALVILVASPQLLDPPVRSPRQMTLANSLARYAEFASPQTSSAASSRTAGS